MRWPWRKQKGRHDEATHAQRAKEETEHRAEQAKEMRVQAETQAAAEWRWLMPRLAGDDDTIAARIEDQLRRGRQR